jgi:geranylgeranyl pyrophosphate synthase
MDTETLGKSQGSDQARNKPTYPSIVGLSEAKQLAEDLYEQAVAAVAELDEGGAMLTWIAEYIIRRQR